MSTRTYSQQDVLIHKLIEDLQSNGKKSEKSDLKKVRTLGDKRKIKVYKIGPPEHDPMTVINRLSFNAKQAQSTYRDFLNIENYKISALAPEVKFYLVDPSDPKKLFPFYFPISSDYNIQDANGVIEPKLSINGSMSPFTSQAATIDQFSINLRGNNLFEVGTKQLDANLSLTVDNLSVLFEGHPPGFAPLADLFMIRTSTSRKIQQAASKVSGNALSAGTSLQVVATMKYNAENNLGIFTSNELEALTSSMLVINLFYGGQHNISVQEDGSAKVSISYNGFLGSMKNDHRFDMSQSAKAAAMVTRKKAALAAGAGQRVPATKNLSKTQSTQTPKHTEPPEEINYFSRKAVFEKAMNLLYQNDMIKTLDASSSQDHMKRYLSKAATSPAPAATGSNLNAPKPAPKKWIDNFGFPKSVNDFRKYLSGKRFISYVYFGDFLAAALASATTIATEKNEEIKKQLKQLKEKQQKTEEENTKIEELELAKREFPNMLNQLDTKVALTSNVQLPISGQQGKSLLVNLADIPISISQICTTFYRELGNGQQNSYDLSDLLGDFSLKIINNALNSRASINLIDSVSIKQIQTQGPRISSKASTIDVQYIRRQKVSVKNIMTYYIFTQNASPRTNAPGVGDPKVDVRNGIMHLRLSQDRGLVKSINFTQIDIGGKKEYHIAKDGNLFDELRIPTNATIEMYGNNIFIPGMMVYINPSSLGFGDPRGNDSPAARLGIGGYYTIQTVTTTFSSNGSLNTSLTATYLGPPSKKGEDMDSPSARRANDQAQQLMSTAAASIGAAP